jgi:hypothetical protein
MCAIMNVKVYGAVYYSALILEGITNLLPPSSFSLSFSMLPSSVAHLLRAAVYCVHPSAIFLSIDPTLPTLLTYSMEQSPS